MISARNWMRGLAAVAAVVITGTAQAVTIEHNPSGGYTTINSTSTVNAGFGVIPNYPNDYISQALVTVYLADNDPGSNDEVAGFQIKVGSGAWVNIASPTYLVSATHVNQDSNVGTYEVDGSQCPYGTLQSDSRCKNYYDTYVFDVTTLIKENMSFNLLVNSVDNDTSDSFWYKGSLLTYTTKTVKVPEPATLGLLGLGLMGIGIARRRKLA